MTYRLQYSAAEHHSLLTAAIDRSILQILRLMAIHTYLLIAVLATVGQERTRTWGSYQSRAMSYSPGKLDFLDINHFITSSHLDLTVLLNLIECFYNINTIIAIFTMSFQLPTVCAVHVLSGPPSLILDHDQLHPALHLSALLLQHHLCSSCPALSGMFHIVSVSQVHLPFMSMLQLASSDT